MAIRLPASRSASWHGLHQLATHALVAVDGSNPPNITGDVGYWQSGLYIEHVATGLFVYGALWSGVPERYAHGHQLRQRTWLSNSEPDHWYVKAGLRERWTSLGHTVLYGFYGQRNDMISELPSTVLPFSTTSHEQHTTRQ